MIRPPVSGHRRASTPRACRGCAEPAGLLCGHCQCRVCAQHSEQRARPPESGCQDPHPSGPHRAPPATGTRPPAASALHLQGERTSQGVRGLSGLLRVEHLAWRPAHAGGNGASVVITTEATSDRSPVFPNQPETPEVKVMQDRLAAANLRMSDLRNQTQSLRQELRMAQKVFPSQTSGLLGWGWAGDRHGRDNGPHSGLAPWASHCSLWVELQGPRHPSTSPGNRPFGGAGLLAA